MVGGYAGRILKVDLTTRRIEKKRLDLGIARKFMGGRGLAGWFLWKMTDEKTDPLGPRNPLIFMTGPLTGIPATRVVAVAKSPINGLFGNSNAGGPFGPEIKFAGYDGIIFSGKSDNPVYLYVRDDEVEIRDAHHLLGMDTWETEERIKE